MGIKSTKKGNVLVVGNSGVGKSTLINAVMGDEVAKTGCGTKGTTDKLEIYEAEDRPFRIIDTIGFEPNLLKAKKAVDAVKKWSKDSAKNGNEDTQINVIWFCVDGTRKKLFEEDLKIMSKAISIWKSVPVIVVITKSYSMTERPENVEMVCKAFDQQKKAPNVNKIIPVVAKTYTINETAFAPPDGITELIEDTNKLMPVGFQAAKNDLAEFVLNRKRVLAQSIVATATTGGVVVGAVPVPFPDALLLTPAEIAEVNAIALIYDIHKSEDSKLFLKSIVDVGTVSTTAKTIISGLKAIPGVNLAAGVINAAIAGIIVATLGEGTIYACEQVYLGNKTLDDIDWVKNIIESKFAKTLIEKAKPILANLTDSSDKKDIIKAVLELMNSVFDMQGKDKNSK